jgi:hypothetical protein
MFRLHCVSTSVPHFVRESRNVSVITYSEVPVQLSQLILFSLLLSFTVFTSTFYELKFFELFMFS